MHTVTNLSTDTHIQSLCKERLYQKNMGDLTKATDTRIGTNITRGTAATARTRISAKKNSIRVV